MARNKLSARFAETTKKPGRHSDGEGLYLVVSATGSRKWVWRFTVAGKAYDRGLGSPDAARGGTMRISLEEARRRATTLRAKVAAGLKPEAIRLQDDPEPDALSIPTFGEVADEYITAMGPGFKSAKHLAQWKSSLGTVPYATGRVRKNNKAAITLYLQALTELRAKPVDQVTTDDVMAVLRPIWAVVPETAGRLRGRIDAVLDAAKARGLRAGDNPAQWDGHLESLLSKRSKTHKHHSAMPYDALPGFMKALRASPSISGLALEMAILTASRTGEVLGAVWSEVDESSKAVWTIPEQRMKAGKKHVVPLSPRTLEILNAVRPFRNGDHVFPGRTSKAGLSNMALTMLLRRLGHKKFTVHGFRSSFRDWAAETTPFPRQVCEAALAHSVGSQTEKSYLRTNFIDIRRKLMEAWADFCNGPQAPQG